MIICGRVNLSESLLSGRGRLTSLFAERLIGTLRFPPEYLKSGIEHLVLDDGLNRNHTYYLRLK